MTPEVTAITDSEAKEALECVMSEDEETFIDFDKMKGKDIDILLKNMGLPRGGLVHERRERLRNAFKG